MGWVSNVLLLANKENCLLADYRVLLLSFPSWLRMHPVELEIRVSSVLRSQTALIQPSVHRFKDSLP